MVIPKQKPSNNMGGVYCEMQQADANFTGGKAWQNAFRFRYGFEAIVKIK